MGGELSLPQAGELEGVRNPARGSGPRVYHAQYRKIYPSWLYNILSAA